MVQGELQSLPHIVYKDVEVWLGRPSWSSSIPRSKFPSHLLVQVPVWSCSLSRPCTTLVTCLMPSGHVFNISPHVTFVILGDDILCFYIHTGRIRLIVFTHA